MNTPDAEQYRIALRELRAYDSYVVNTGRGGSSTERGGGIYTVDQDPAEALRDFLREVTVETNQPGEVSVSSPSEEQLDWRFELKDIQNKQPISGVRLTATDEGTGGILLLRNLGATQTIPTEAIITRYQDHREIAVGSPHQPLLRQLICSAAIWTRDLFANSRGTDAVFTDPDPSLWKAFYGEYPELRPVIPQRSGRRY